MTPRRLTHRACAAVMATLIVFALTCAARAQPMLQPVDPAVGDLDLLSHNLRIVEPGLRSIGEQSNLFTLQPLGGVSQEIVVPVYYRLAPGFRARVDRMEYIVSVDERTARRNVTPVRDGFYLERFPANTVFEMSPRFELASEPPAPLIVLPSAAAQSPSRTEQRIDTRLDNRIDHRVDLRVNNRVDTRIDDRVDLRTSIQTNDTRE